MLSDNLKEQTLANHQQLEKLLVGKIKSVATEQDYINLLQLFYGYFGGLEKVIDQYIGKDQLPDYNHRRKTDAIADDIASLGGTPVQEATGADLPLIDDTAKAFGALYVIEGSTLGGSIISKMISSKLGLQNGLSFFNGYGEASHKMWGIFKAALNNLPENDGQEIIRSANDTFAGFDAWIKKSVA
ncbi:biliverdin-producing heme oxygenase [Mucilaginibacter ginkgonis]|uniref:Biliverdin-producing heme oxygenase n=1 Tax=Mucilaginibacter ginkgonis TaxID=2682091 RepID=A0A6I4HYK5_9SPHI|nr:biliverdin-producing heme oxygenase [Mucilaginibacter ginkgonis]QQL49758.1 biliverdin-producing heme oxygenase [Mucilaginibacter ginkgonis]